MQTRIDDQRKRREMLAGKLMLARQNDAQKREIESRLAILRAALSVAETFERAERDIAAATRLVEEKVAAQQAALRVEQRQQQTFEAAEQALAEVQAFHLASRLVPGRALPGLRGDRSSDAGQRHGRTCRSLDQAFRDSRTAWQRASAETRAAEQALAAARSVLSDRQERLAGLAKPEAAAGDLKAQTGGAEAALSALGPEVDIAALDGEIERLRMEAQACDADFLRLRDAWSDRSRDVAALHATLDEMLSDVPEDLRNRERLAERQTRAKRELTARVNAGEVAEKAATAARETALRAEKDLEAATTALEFAAERQRRSAVMFETRLAEAGLSEEDYRQLKAFFRHD